MIRVLMPTDGTDLHVLIFPAEDLPGIWVAHVLEADLVTQGLSPGDALDMAIDAWSIVPAEGRDRPAPAEDWARWNVRRTGRVIPSLLQLKPLAEAQVVPNQELRREHLLTRWRPLLERLAQ